jgi:integrase
MIMATEKVTIYRKYHGKAPTDKAGRPLSRETWRRKRPFRWAVRWFGSEGKRYSRSFKTRKEAELFAEIRQSEVRNGKADPPPPVTLRDFVAEHAKVMPGQVKFRTLSDQMRALHMFMAHVGDSIRLKKVSPRHAECFIAARLAAGVAVSTVNKDIRTLKGVFNRAIEPRGYLSPGNNPFGKIKRRRETEMPIRYVTTDEYEALIDTSERIWWKALISVAYGCGFRREEMLNLTWMDIDFEKHRICVVAKRPTADLLAWEPKDYEARVLPVPSQTMRLLVDLQVACPEKCPYVFIPAGRWHYILQARSTGKWSEDKALVNNLGSGFHKLRTKADVRDCTLHDLRRSCITNWARVLPMHVVQKLAGHSDIKTTQRYYLAVRQEDMERARILQSKILANDLTDPLLTHFAREMAENSGQGRN